MQDKWYRVRQEGLALLDSTEQGRAMGISMTHPRPNIAGVTEAVLCETKLLISVSRENSNEWVHKLAGVFIAKDIAFKVLPTETSTRGSAVFEVTGKTPLLKEAWKRLVSHIDYFEQRARKN